MAETILSVKDLLVKRSEQTVLQVDALDIQQGEVLAVIGPNGAGKSTLLLVLGRLLEPQSGQVYFQWKTHRTGRHPDLSPAHRPGAPGTSAHAPVGLR